MKPRAVININGEEVVMDSFYRAFHEKDGLVISVDMANKILNVENLNENKIAKIVSKDVMVMVMPRQTVQLTSFYFTDPEFNFTLKEKSAIRHEDEEELDEDRADCWD